MEGKVYLKPNVVIEPLIDNWYAWSHLVSPATAAMNIKNRHMEIMESYVDTPELHEMAVANPALLGGPFIDYPERKVEVVQELIRKTKTDRSYLIEMAEALTQLDRMLLESADGHSLQDLYDKVPETLKGYVELVYDLNNQVSYRVIEPLLFNSPFYDNSSQSLMLSITEKDDRPFVMSTPRTEDEQSLELRIPFESSVIDELFQMKSTPQPLGNILQRLGDQNGKSDLLRSFFTEEEPPAYDNYEGEGIRWRYFGHACILIEVKGFSVLFDPVLSYTYESDISRYTYQDLPDEIDYVVITHNHQDHILLETLLQLRHKVKHIVVPRNGGGALQDPSLKLTLKHLGYKNIIELDELESIDTPKGSLVALPFLGEHADLNIRTKAAWLMEINDKKILLAADSCNLEPALYRHIHQIYGDLDVLFLGMECDGAPLSWLYGPLLTKPLPQEMDKSRRLAGSNFERGIDIVERFDCKEVYVYAMGQEPWLNHVMAVKYTEDSNPIIASNKLLDMCKEKGRVAERLFGEKELILG